jgi:uncharacterized membrane-anchored protein
MRFKTVHLVVILPVAAMACWLLSLNVALMRAREVTLAVTGYDPRDLLSGHYLRYRVDYGLGSEQNRLTGGYRNEDFCACLTPDSSGISKASWAGRCAERDSLSCPIFVKGKSSWNGLNAGIERYYIPEGYQHSLARIPPNASIKVRVTASGTAYVTGMYVGDLPILEWAKQQS